MPCVVYAHLDVLLDGVDHFLADSPVRDAGEGKIVINNGAKSKLQDNSLLGSPSFLFNQNLADHARSELFHVDGFLEGVRVAVL